MIFLTSDRYDAAKRQIEKSLPCGGFRCYRVAKLRQTDLSHLLSRGYSFQQEVLYRCRKAGCRIGETPILFENRRKGASKVNLYEALRSIAVILWVGLGALFRADG